MINKKQYINYLLFIFIVIVLSCSIIYYIPSIINFIPAYGAVFVPRVIGVLFLLFVIIVTTITLNKCKTINNEIPLLDKKEDNSLAKRIFFIELAYSVVLVSFLFVLYFVIAPAIAENKDIINYNEWLRYILSESRQDWCLLIVNTLIFVPTIMLDRFFLFKKTINKPLFWLNYIAVFGLCTSFIPYIISGMITGLCYLIIGKSFIPVRNDILIYSSFAGYISYFLIKINFLQKIK